MTSEEIAVQIEHHRNEIESLKHRMKGCEEQQNLLHKVVSTTEKLAINMEYMAKEQKEQGDRLKKIEQEPADNYKHYKRLIIGCIITGIIGALIGAVITLIIGG